MARTVLVVDSDANTLELVSAVLTRHGFAVATTADAAAALQRCRVSPPDLLLADFDHGGDALCAGLHEAARDTRVVLLCGAEIQDEAERRSLLDRHGCDGLLARPFRFDPLRELLAAWGWLDEGEQQAPSTIFAFSVPAPSPLDLTLLVEPMVAQPAAPASSSAPTLPTPIPLPIPVPAPAPRPETRAGAPARPAPAGFAGQSAAAAGGEVELDLDAVIAAEPELDLDAIALEPTADDAASGPAATVPIRAAGFGAARPAGVSRLPPGVPRHGDLTSTPLPRLLFELYLGTYSGIVRLARKGVHRAIYLWAGLPVGIDSEQLDESLGVLLRESGRITPEQYDNAQELVLSRGMRMGEALVAAGVLRESELLDALREQTELKLVNTFAWRDGTYSIEDDTRFAKDTILSEVPPVRAIWRGIREHYELVPLLEFFSRLRTRYVVATDQLGVHYETIGPFLRDLDVASFLDGRTTFEAALRSNDDRSVETAQALYFLLVTDMVRASAGPGAPASFLEHRAAAQPEPALVDYRQLMEVADRVARDYLRVKAADHFAALGIGRDAPVEQVEAAYHTIADRLRADGQTPGLPHDAVRRCRELQELLAEARRVLLDPEQRARYAAGLEEAYSPPDTELALEAGQSRDPSVRRRQAFIAAEQAYREGMRLLEGGDVAAARERLQAAVQGNATEPAYRVGLAEAMSRDGAGGDAAADRAAALHQIEEALRLDPGSFAANLAAARLLLDGGDTERARGCVEKVLQRAPHHQLARRMLEEMISL